MSTPLPHLPAPRLRSAAPACFGKLPTADDPLYYNLAGALAPLAQRLDERLQAAMALGRHRYGRPWPARFATAPNWRFALPGNSADTGAVLALAVASRDRFGRPFPLLALGPLPPGTSVAVGPFACDDWFAKVEALLERATDGKLQPAALTGGLSAIGAPQPDPAFDDALCRRLLEEHTGPLADGSGIWWTFGFTTGGLRPGQATLQAATDLPSPDHLAEILAGTWGSEETSAR